MAAWGIDNSAQMGSEQASFLFSRVCRCFGHSSTHHSAQHCLVRCRYMTGITIIFIIATTIRIVICIIIVAIITMMTMTMNHNYLVYFGFVVIMKVMVLIVLMIMTTLASQYYDNGYKYLKHS